MVDCFYAKGDTHKICQDYAMAGMTRNGHPFAMIADGTSALRIGDNLVDHPHSDFASRLVCFAARRCLLEMEAYNDVRGLIHGNFLTMLRGTMNSVMGLLELEPTTADATLLVALGHAPFVSVNILGDGVVIFEYETKLEVIIRDYEPNYPMYVNHLISQKSSDKRTELDIETKELTVIVDKTGNVRSRNVRDLEDNVKSLDNLMLRPVPHAEGETEDLRSVSVCSDGLTQFHGMRPEEVALEMTKFKSRKGLFVKRRVGAFMRHAPQHDDDISIATINFE